MRFVVESVKILKGGPKSASKVLPSFCLHLCLDNFPKQSYVLSSKVGTQFDIPLSVEEEGIAHEYQDKLRTFGLDFLIVTQETNFQIDEEKDKQNVNDYLRVTHVPTCFILREENERKYNRSFSMPQITTTLVRELIDIIKSTRGGGLGILPKTINDILSSRACRGKIFGFYNS